MTDQQSQKSFEELISKLQSKNPDIRLTAIHEIVGLEDDRVPELIVIAMSDEYDRVRLGAVWGIISRYYEGQLRPRSEGQHYIASLLELLESEKELLNREFTIMALGMPKDPLAVEPLIGFLNDGLPSIREAAVQALGMIGDVRAIEPLAKALQDKDSRVRWMAASTLGNMNDVRSVMPLIEALSDDSTLYPRHIESVVGTTVGEMARRALEKIGKSDIQILVQALEHEDERIRVDVAAILVQAGNLPFEPLIACLSSNIYQIRVLAIQSLGMMRDVRAVEPLISLLDGDVATLYLTVWALDSIGDARAIKPLTELFKYTQNANLQKQIQLGDKRAEKISEDPWGRVLIRRALKAALHRLGYSPDID